MTERDSGKAQSVPGMPETMTVVLRRLDEPSQRLALSNWLLIGEVRRQRYRIYVGRGRSPAARRARSKDAVTQLLAVDRSLWRG